MLEIMRYGGDMQAKKSMASYLREGLGAERGSGGEESPAL